MQSLFSCPVHPPVECSRTLKGDTAAHLKNAAEAAGERKRRTMLLKMCRCGKLIPQTVKMCEACEKQEQSRHVIYNNTRRDKRAAEFYLSKEWRALRPIVLQVFDYIDIYALYVNKQIITLSDSDPIHHIIELDDDWKQRLNPFNLIPLSHNTHNSITALYKESNANMKATQTQIRGLIKYHFKEVGGIEKVFEKAGIVAPPHFF